MAHGIRHWRTAFVVGLPLSMLLAFVAAFVAVWSLQPDGRQLSTARVVDLRRITDAIGLEETPALSPDGNRVAYVAYQGERRRVWVRLVSGGTPVAVTSPDTDAYGPRWSPDSNTIVYHTPAEEHGEHGTAWEVPALGGSPRRVTSALGPGDLSRDGTELAVFRAHEGNVELAAVKRDTGSVRRIALMPSAVYLMLRWSPDGESIAFAQTSGASDFAHRLFIVHSGGGDPRVISDDSYLQGLDWLPDGAGLVVSSARGSMMAYPPTYNLWVVPIDGSPSTQLTFGEHSYEFPDVALDGEIVVSRVRTHSDVWKFPTSGDPKSNAQSGVPITRQTGIVQTVSVSPDETEVVFLSDNGGHANVWAARVADGAMRAITRERDSAVVVAVPVWSPRGDWITFLSSRGSRTPYVTTWLARPDGSEMRDLGVPGVWTCWSPDGRFLYYTVRESDRYLIRKQPVDAGAPITVRDDDAIACGLHGGTLYYARPLIRDLGAWDHEIRAAEPETGPSRVLGTVAGIRVPSAPYDFQPVPSPDGQWLAVPLLDGPTTNMWAMSTTTGDWKMLTDFGARNVMITRRIAWSRDGKHIYASVSDVDSDVVMVVGALGARKAGSP